MSLARRTVLSATAAGVGLGGAALAGCSSTSTPEPSTSASTEPMTAAEEGLDKLAPGWQKTPVWTTREFGWLGGPVVESHDRLWFVVSQQLHTSGATPQARGDWPVWIVGIDPRQPDKLVASEKVPVTEGTSSELVTIDRDKGLHAWQYDTGEFMLVQLGKDKVTEVWRGKAPGEPLRLEAGNNPFAHGVKPGQTQALVDAVWKPVGDGSVIGVNSRTAQPATLQHMDWTLRIGSQVLAKLPLSDEIGPISACCPEGIYVMDPATLKEWFYTWQGKSRKVTRTKDLAPAAAIIWGNRAISTSGRFVYGKGGALDQQRTVIHSTLQRDGQVGDVDSVVWVDEQTETAAVLHRMDHDTGLMQLEKVSQGKTEREVLAEGVLPLLATVPNQGGGRLGLVGTSVLTGAGWDAGVGLPLALCASVS